MKKINFFFVMTSLLMGFQVHAGLLFNYSQLTTKNLDQMNKMVQDKVAESRSTKSGQMVPLKEALQAVYSRPNDDGMIDKIVAPLRSNLDELGDWEKVVSQLTDEAINALKNPRAFKPVVQVTYIVFLENLLSEMKPLLKTPNDSKFERQIAERIRDAKVEITKEAINERSLRAMRSLVSPSELAGKLLADVTVAPL